ncbi:MAG: NADH-ubiquinone oxidoreductase-F iron-sulfur binding region domain-containing protein [Gemmatimonadota bacterium]
MEERRLLLRDIEIPDIDTLPVYERRGGYAGAAAAFGPLKSDEIIAAVAAAGLRGRGGSWAPVADRWLAAAGHPDRQRFLAINAGETDPGLFRDRKLAERLPHRLLEGTIIAARAMGAQVAYICQRPELRRGWQALERALAEAYEAGWLGRDVRGTGVRVDVYLHPCGGACIGGEETALLASLEGRRAEPRAPDGRPPPHLLFGHPAVVHNAGTVAYLPLILADGGAAFRACGTELYRGTCVFCVSGHVRRPGLYEVELGAGTLRDLVEGLAGGVREGRHLKAVLPGGYAAPPLAPEQLDVALTPEAWALPGGGRFPGVFLNGGIIAMDDTACMVDAAVHLMRFYAAESCGQCPPCREGSLWLLRLLERLEAGAGQPGDVDLVADLARQVSPYLDLAGGTSLCGFGTAFAWVLQGFTRLFREEFDHHLQAGGCPVPKDDAIKVPDSVNIRF